MKFPQAASQRWRPLRAFAYARALRSEWRWLWLTRQRALRLRRSHYRWKSSRSLISSSRLERRADDRSGDCDTHRTRGGHPQAQILVGRANEIAALAY